MISKLGYAINQTDTVKDKTDKSRGNSSIVVSYRKAQIISNYVAQLNAMLASTLRATLKSSNLLTTEHKEQN